MVTPQPDGFTFVGAAANNELEGKFTDDPMTVRLVHAPAGAFGGASYGGDAYGGDPWSI